MMKIAFKLLNSILKELLYKSNGLVSSFVLKGALRLCIGSLMYVATKGLLGGAYFYGA